MKGGGGGRPMHAVSLLSGVGTDSPTSLLFRSIISNIFSTRTGFFLLFLFLTRRLARLYGTGSCERRRPRPDYTKWPIDDRIPQTGSGDVEVWLTLQCCTAVSRNIMYDDCYWMEAGPCTQYCILYQVSDKVYASWWRQQIPVAPD